MSNKTYNFTKDYKSGFNKEVTKLIEKVNRDMETGGSFAYKRVDRVPQPGDTVLLIGDKKVSVFKDGQSVENVAIVFEKNRAVRIVEIQHLTDAYIEQTGESPPSDELERLTDVILAEELKDRHPDKITRNEYPFMSDWQIKLRRDNEYSEKLAEEIGSDGKNRAKPKRRRRTNKENAIVDRYTKIRNAERRKQYRKDTAPGAVITRKLSPKDVESYLTKKYRKRLTYSNIS